MKRPTTDHAIGSSSLIAAPCSLTITYPMITQPSFIQAISFDLTPFDISTFFAQFIDRLQEQTREQIGTGTKKFSICLDMSIPSAIPKN